MTSKFENLKTIVESLNIKPLSGDELKFITGGLADSGGSQTSGTGSQSSTCCDGTCVCRCYPTPPTAE